ncbi:MAG: YlbF family regulator [Planctomycetes bacterium]|nr:YlbF family regulator [Planctomycetota bacterium]
MDEVIEIAEKLSQAIARSVRYRDLRKAEKAAMADPEAMALFKARADAAQKIAEKERAKLPIEPEDKRALLAAEQKIRTNAILGELSRAQADFHEMLNIVNGKITAALEPPADQS